MKKDLKLPEDSGKPPLLVNNLGDKDGSASKVGLRDKDKVGGMITQNLGSGGLGGTQGGAILKDMSQGPKVMHEMGVLSDTSISSGLSRGGATFNTPSESSRFI